MASNKNCDSTRGSEQYHDRGEIGHQQRPSRLISQQLTVHLRHDRLDPFLRGHFIKTLPRLHRHYDRKGTLRWIDFRRVIESLRRKPRALLRAQLQAEILPGELLDEIRPVPKGTPIPVAIGRIGPGRCSSSAFVALMHALLFDPTRG